LLAEGKHPQVGAEVVQVVVKGGEEVGRADTGELRMLC